MILLDFKCPDCGKAREELVDRGEVVLCEKCGGEMVRGYTDCAKLLITVIPSYPGCYKKRAGYMHTGKADHDATKIQVGYGGGQRPKD